MNVLQRTIPRVTPPTYKFGNDVQPNNFTSF